MATARRIIFSTYVIPTKSLEMEETSIRQTEFQDSPGKALGGKGFRNINEAQWGDKWSSVTHPDIQNWEEFTTVNWEDVLIHPGESGKLTIATSAIQLSTDANDCAFLYIKNLGTSEDTTYDDAVTVSLNGTSGDYYIIVPPGGSVNIKGYTTGDSAFDCNDVYVKCASGTTQIEYLIAKE